MHDGVSPIVVAAGRWQDQHQRLWEMLVPAKGAASTVQGEVIRISGRIVNELDGNGGANWDADYKRMSDALLAHLRSGVPLPPADLAAAAALVAETKLRAGEPSELARWAVAWVQLNPLPILLPPPTSKR